MFRKSILKRARIKRGITHKLRNQSNNHLDKMFLYHLKKVGNNG